MSLSASPAERLIAPPIRTLDRRYAASLALGLALHVAALAFLLYRDDPKSAAPQPLEEIPVELVQEVPEPAPAPPPEPPPPDEKPAEPEQQPQAQASLDEAPATDAPRLRSEEDSREDAPKPAETPTSPPRQAAEAPPPPVPVEQPLVEQAQPPLPPPLPQTAEAEIAAPELRREAPPTPPPPPPPPRASQKSLSDVLAAFEPLPNYEFAAPSRMSPIEGGAAQTTYLSILYGMVKSHMRLPPRRRGGGTVEGAITFLVDRNGRLMQARIAKPSGAPELDGAALAAVRAASPFPRTPTGAPLRLTFSYVAN